MTEYYSKFRGLKKIIVYELQINEGMGTGDDPILRVTYYLDKDGNILFVKGDDKERKFRGN